MERAVGAFMYREKEAAFQQEVANQNAFNQVRKPIFGPRPVAPQERTRPSDNTTRDLLFGVGSSLAGGVLRTVPAGASIEHLPARCKVLTTIFIHRYHLLRPCWWGFLRIC